MAVSGAWARPSIGQTGSSALYFQIVNQGATGDALVGVDVPQAAAAQLHTSILNKDVVQMRAVGEVSLLPGIPVVFEPKANHVMLMGLTKPLQSGDHLSATLRFKIHAPVSIEALVAMTAPSP